MFIGTINTADLGAAFLEALRAMDHLPMSDTERRERAERMAWRAVIEAKQAKQQSR